MAGDSWTECSVDELKSSAPNALATGPFGSAISSRYFVNEGVPVIRGGNLSQNVGTRLIDDGLVFLSVDKAKEFSRSVARRGDLVFTCWGTIDQVGLIDQGCRFEEYVVSNKQMKLTPDPKKVSSLFLYYLFSSHSMRSQILSQGIGSSVPGFNLGQLRSTRLTIPPLTEQRAIAHILGTLDDKIELNRKMNETLEAMARAMFQSWFVDFDPVRVIGEGRALHLSAQLADLFPRSFEGSELGDIPTGWVAGTLASIANLNPEAWYRETRPAAIRYVDLSNTKWGRIEAVTPHSREDAPSRAQRVLRPGDSIVGTVRPGNGSYAFVSEEGLTGSTGFAVLRPKQPSYAEFVYLAATARENIDALAHLADGGAYPAVRPEVVMATPIAKPPDEILAAFSRLTKPWFEKCSVNHREADTLAALRDTLLPKLISGELRVKDAERFVVDNS